MAAVSGNEAASLMVPQARLLVSGRGERNDKIRHAYLMQMRLAGPNVTSRQITVRQSG